MIAFPKSDETIYEKTDISTSCDFKSNNPFLDLILGKIESPEGHKLNSISSKSDKIYDTADGPDLSSGGSIKDRLMRLKNLGVC